MSRGGRSARGRRIAVAALLIGAIAAACGKPVEPESGAAAGSPLKIVKMNANPSLFQGPMFLAKEEGYFEAEGIDARLLEIDPSSALVALVGGDLDVVSGPVRSAIFNLILRGSTIRVVAGREMSAAGGCVSQAFTAPAAMADDILATGNLRGRKFILFRGGVTEYLAAKLLASRGLDLSDVEVAQIPQGEYGSAADRRYEAVRYLFEPQLGVILQQGGVKIIASDEEFAPGSQRGVIVFGRRLLRDDPDLGRRFMRAWLRGVRRFEEGKTERNVAILSRHTRLPEETIRRACWPHFSADGSLNLDSVHDQIAWSRGKGYVEGEIADAQWWDPSFIDAARHQ